MGHPGCPPAAGPPPPSPPALPRSSRPRPQPGGLAGGSAPRVGLRQARPVAAPRRSARRLPLPARGRPSAALLALPPPPRRGPSLYYGNSDIQRERLAQTAVPRLPGAGGSVGGRAARTSPRGAAAAGLQARSPRPPAALVPGRCGAAPSPGPRWPASCGQDLAARTPAPGKDGPSAWREIPSHCSYMAKFLAELLGCTLPSKGASPMFEVGGGCVPAAMAVCGGGGPLTGALGSPGVNTCTASLNSFPPGSLGRGAVKETGTPGFLPWTSMNRFFFPS